MSNQTDHTIVRLRVPPELKKLIEESAEQNNRSQSAEMVARLEKSFEETMIIDLDDIPQITKVVAKSMEYLVKELHKQGVDGEKLEQAIKSVSNQ
ncbi:Arc family DNA-binding protein [Acinetobacter sp. NIPH 1958]|uniref:Arc family DNA-binding protein n=1 Tax=Acinetobacter sp. NIPH 1958 TaxID=2923430 RepID=UPI001F4BA87B|nr:Arc family DNA-binding protein [Acinetobacter sp. NIPH 1958]MCH7357270.1 Arc family DNA-binding protein [Acinetobacter sp. NIPH 1958]